MPKLITRKARPARSRAQYGAPSSPFQKLIDSARLKKGWSVRELARRIEANQGSVWIWLHSKNGAPAKRSLTEPRMKLLSQELGIPMPRIKDAIDASRAIYTPREAPQPAAAVDAFAEFVDVLRAMDPGPKKNRRVSLRRIISLADRYLASVTK